MTELLTVKEATEAVGLNVATIRALIARRKLPCVNFGPTVRTPAEAIAGNKVSKKRGE